MRWKRSWVSGVAPSWGLVESSARDDGLCLPRTTVSGVTPSLASRRFCRGLDLEAAQLPELQGSPRAGLSTLRRGQARAEVSARPCPRAAAPAAAGQSRRPPARALQGTWHGNKPEGRGLPRPSPPSLADGTIRGEAAPPRREGSVPGAFRFKSSPQCLFPGVNCRSKSEGGGVQPAGASRGARTALGPGREGQEGAALPAQRPPLPACLGRAAPDPEGPGEGRGQGSCSNPSPGPQGSGHRCPCPCREQQDPQVSVALQEGRAL